MLYSLMYMIVKYVILLKVCLKKRIFELLKVNLLLLTF